MKLFVYAWFILTMTLFSGVAYSYNDKSANELIQKVLDRYVGETQLSTLSLVTCAYEIKNEKLGCSSTPRRKKITFVGKNYGEKLKDSRGLMLILEPVSESGIGILQYDYDAKGKDTDQWLYLPELGQVKRVASSEDAPKKGSLFGSEFSMEDVEVQKADDYNYKILKEDSFNSRPVMLIEQTPTEKRAEKSNYSKRIQWVDIERLILLKTDFYDWSGKLIKSSYTSQVENINNIWTVRKQIMRNLQTDRISILSVDEITYNLKITDDILTQRVLSDAVFRKTKLKSLRENG